MRTLTSLSLFLWVTFAIFRVLGQFEEGQIPQCASTCTYGALQSEDCQATDYACLCKDSMMLEFLVPCTGAMCEVAEIEQTIQAIVDLCAGVGVTLSISTTWSATALTSAATTTTPASSRSPPRPSVTQTSSDATSTAVSSTQSRSSPSTTPSETPTDTSRSGGSSKLSTGAIVGIAVGIAVPVISLFISLYIIFRLRSRKRDLPILPVSKESAPENWGGIGPDNDAPGVLETGR
ncbi:hypothetical protein TWF730_011193 [Orbilia blumenaviensis]|uniref:CFEM domain-containing protein n=1 Tax=Orbilia blumenaviensis TaxID=1796055 RepID=A0AAV9UJW6_9PEZI